jgi:hypothetical protein
MGKSRLRNQNSFPDALVQFGLRRKGTKESCFSSTRSAGLVRRLPARGSTRYEQSFLKTMRRGLPSAIGW